MTEKQKLRSEMRSSLNKFCANKKEFEIASSKASDIFLSSALYENATFICAFCSTANEIKTQMIIESAIRDGKRVALPRSVQSTCEMDFFILDKNRKFDEQLVIGAYDIYEPCVTLEKLQFTDIFFEKENIVFLVPALAFDKSGARLGKGKGFYDRYFENLAHFIFHTNQHLLQDKKYLSDGFANKFFSSNNFLHSNKYKISLAGFCFSFQLLEKIPSEIHDIFMTHIISDKSIMECRLSK